MKQFFITAIRFYQRISHTPAVQAMVPSWMGCRQYPTCSEHAILVIQRYGALQGGWRALIRTLRCNPLIPAFIHAHD